MSARRAFLSALVLLAAGRARAEGPSLQPSVPDAAQQGADGREADEAARAEPAPTSTAAVEPTTPVDVSALEPQPETDDTMSTSELEALGLDLEGPVVDTSLHFSGFADFSANFPIQPRGIGTLYLKNQSFYIGNLNLYLSKNLTDSFRTMSEVRLTYLPNGAVKTNQTGFGYDSTATMDYANTSQVTRWGGIILQRVYLEWTLHRLAVVRGGQFLTPYGIWNVDHGSPTYIPVLRPYAINNEFFPERQTGFELFGRWDATNLSVLGYHLTFSNGTGPISEYRDLDRNKAVGGRLYWEYHGLGYLRVGASGYYGRDTASQPQAGLVGGKVQVVDAVSSQYDNLALAADVLFKSGGLHLQGEWVSQQRRYTQDGRVTHDLYLGPVAKAASSDSLSWGCYGLAAYQLRWYALTPYYMQEYVREVVTRGTPDAKFGVLVYHVGINIHPADAVVFKAEYSHGKFLRQSPLYAYPIQAVQLQAAWAF